MDLLVISWILVAGGLYFGVRNVRFLRNAEALRQYMQNSPKAALWVRKYGLEGATKMARESLIPLGLIISAAMLAMGGWNLWRLYA